MLTRTRPICGAALRDGGDLIDVVGAARAGIDPAGHAVLQGQLRPFLAAAGMGVDVDQARGDDLAARIDRFGGVARDVGIDRRDLAADDRHVADRIEPDRGIDDAPALDDQIIGRREHVRDAGEHRSTGSGCGDELAPVHHDPPTLFGIIARSVARQLGEYPARWH